MHRHHVDLVSHWHLNAPVELVWAALTEPGRWPRWWPSVKAVRTMHTGDARGIGRITRIHWSSGFGYPLVLDIETVEALRHERLRGRSRGDLRGEGIWLLRSDGWTTDVTYVWRVQLERPWMRALAPLLAPLFRWNHERVMREGCIGLARHLGVAHALVPLR